MIETKCPYCQQNFNVEKIFLDREVKCTVCGNTFVIKENSEPVSENLTLRKVNASEEEPVPYEMDRKKKKKLRINKPQSCAIALLILFSVLGGIGYFAWYMVNDIVTKNHEKDCKHTLKNNSLTEKKSTKYVNSLQRATCPATKKDFVYLGMDIPLTGVPFPIAFCLTSHRTKGRIFVLYNNGEIKSVNVGKRKRKPSVLAEFLLEDCELDKDDPRRKILMKNANDMDRYF